MKLLLVEDDPLNGQFFVAALKPDGHTIVVERDGIAGRDRALAVPFDLIVLDIALPGMRGDAVCRALHAAGLRTPIVALTASVLPEQLALIRDVGFALILTKPIEPEALRAAVRRFERSPDVAR